MTIEILFWHSNYRFRDEYRIFDVWNPTLSFELGPNIAFCHSKSYFDIRTSGRITHFDIRDPFLTFWFGTNIAFLTCAIRFCHLFWAEYHILTFEMLFRIRTMGPISHSGVQKSYFSIRTRTEYRIFDIQNTILTFEFAPYIAFRRLKSYFFIWQNLDRT